jgi:hypothetical protein
MAQFPAGREAVNGPGAETVGPPAKILSKFSAENPGNLGRHTGKASSFDRESRLSRMPISIDPIGCPGLGDSTMYLPSVLNGYPAAREDRRGRPSSLPVRRLPDQNRLCRVSASVAVACLIAGLATAQTDRKVRGVAAVQPLQYGPPAKTTINPCRVAPMSHTRSVSQFRTENPLIVPGFDPTELATPSRAGHIHVTVDQSPSHWPSVGGERPISTSLTPRTHRILIGLFNA